MNIYSITEEQLEELASLNPEWPEEVRRREELVAEIKKHLLMPIKQTREAFERSFGKTQDEAQARLLEQAEVEHTRDQVAKAMRAQVEAFVGTPVPARPTKLPAAE